MTADHGSDLSRLYLLGRSEARDGFVSAEAAKLIEKLKSQLTDFHNIDDVGEIRRLREALKQITTVEFAGNCCGCGGDEGFDEVQKIATSALDVGAEHGR